MRLTALWLNAQLIANNREGQRYRPRITHLQYKKKNACRFTKELQVISQAFGTTSSASEYNFSSVFSQLTDIMRNVIVATLK